MSRQALDGNTHHVGQTHVEEEPCGQRGDPLLRGEVRGHRQRDVEADEGGHGAADVQEQRLAHRQAAVEQNGKVACRGRGGRKKTRTKVENIINAVKNFMCINLKCRALN